MYLELFKLKQLPFRLSPDPEFLYLSKAHARAKAYLESTIWFADGFVILTGEVGSGKTTLLETFLHELDRDVVVAQINQTQVSAVEFLQSVLVQFGFQPFRMQKAELLATLNNFLVEQYAAGRKVLLIVDEAQNLSLRVLEEIRMLSGVETTKEKVLRIILAGQPELSQKLDAPELVQLVQRVRLRFHLPALASTDIRGYVQHRLEVAGAAGREIFQPDCFELIYRYAGGVPRLINTLCDTALLAASNAERDQVTPADITAAAEELQWPEFTVRASARARPPVRQGGADSSGQWASARPSGAPLGRLLVLKDGRTIADRELHPGRLIIGRAADADLRINSGLISRHHCQVISNELLSVIEDLNSTNGVLLQGERIRRHSLSGGEVLSLGTYQLMYVDERPEDGHAGTDDTARTGSHPVLPAAQSE
jgi:general secretion pathway protein A